MNLKNLIAPSRVALALPVLGMLIVYMWQPIQDFFITDSFNEAVNLLVESDVPNIDSKRKLLVLHVQPFNKGNVAIHLNEKSQKDSFILELRKIDIPNSSAWLEPSKMELVNKIDLLKDYQDGYVIEPNTSYDEVQSIALPKGFYLAKATLNFSDGGMIDQTIVVNLNDEKK